ELRFVAKWGQWLRYDGKRWKEEETLLAFSLVRDLCRELTRESNSKQGEAKSVLSSKTVNGVEKIARADRRIAAITDQWDSAPWLLNTPAGMVDLKTGALGPHDIGHFATKMTAVGPGGECPLWHEFMKKLTNGDKQLEKFLQQVCGYCLTGDTSEEA